RFGMFIHWGLYAIPAGIWNGNEVGSAGEWIMHGGQIPVADYEPLVDQFNPVKFDADEWVRIAKRAGMKYIVITSKHHDGFCLFDSALTDYDVMSTPFRRDILKELADACHREGLKICWYHSILDWHHPDYLPRRKWDTRPADDANYDRYIDYMKGQLEELLTNYGDIGILWFDGGWEHAPEEHRAGEVAALIRGLQPRIIINNRLGVPQDYDTPEQFIPATGIAGRDWETCMTMNGTWGFKERDTNWKSTEVLIRNLIDIASKGGNFLLNVGPTAAGLIPEASVERLAAMGAWMDVNGESIYGSQPSVFKRLTWGRCTRKQGTLFLHVFDWPRDGRLVVPGLLNPVRKAYLLADPDRAALATERAGEDVVVAVPAEAPDAIASVVVLAIEGEPEVVVRPIAQGEDGVVALKAMDADIHGEAARYEGGRGRDNIGYWTNPKDWVSWAFSIRTPGTFAVEVDYANAPGTGGAEYEVSAGGETLTGTTADTKSWTDFTTVRLGTMTLGEPGEYTLSVTPKSMPKGAVTNLRAVTLRPVEAP
ncbi:MAG: alpha-L-fucosidase, partial [Candidatus Hydrogenedentes bacterium]|nr:alpha-L-fucosidase [Candidatus Hydrogenedentota bacterium]